MNDLQEWINYIIKKGEKLLRKNDLLGFYELAIEDMEKDSYGSGIYIGAVTQFLLNNGINPYEYFTDYIPPCCFCDAELEGEDSIVKNGVVYLPPSIKTIKDNAFNGAQGIDKVDLSNIDFIGECAFCYSSLRELKVNPETKFDGAYQFEGCSLEHVYLPKKDFEEKAIWFLGRFMLDDGDKIEFKAY